MTRVRTYPCVALLLLCGSPKGLIAEGVFTLSFEAPARIIEPAGTRRVEACFAVLSHEGEGTGAQGWSFGVESLSCTVVSATTEGTAAEVESFLVIQIVDPMKNSGRTGFVSATVLHVGPYPELPPRASHRLAKFETELVVSTEPRTATLLYVEDLRGSGFPVPLTVTQAGKTVKPGSLDHTIDISPPLFLRADASSDGKLDIGDPIRIIDALFSGGRPPACEDAADANDDGRIDASDPVHVLGYLFLGGAPPPAPHPECGPDATLDGLRCGDSSPCLP